MTRPRQISRASVASVFQAPARSLNSAFQISTARDCDVIYPVDIQVSSLLIGNAQGTAVLQYADNSGMSTNLVTVCAGTNSTSGVLNLVNAGTATLAGRIPAGKFVRIATTTNAGTVSFALRAERQEVLL